MCGTVHPQCRKAQHVFGTAHYDSLQFHRAALAAFVLSSTDGFSLVWPCGLMPAMVLRCQWTTERKEIFVSAAVKLQTNSHTHKHA